MKIFIVFSVILALSVAENNVILTNDVDDVTPYEAAIVEFESLGGILGECKKPHEDCMAAATSGKEKFKCFVQLGLCLGKRIVGCSKQCVVPLVICKMSSGSSWPALLKCAKDFIQCAVGGCSKGVQIEGLIYEDEDYSPYEAALVEYEKNGGVLDECKVIHEDCMKAATTGGQRVKCFIQLGLCLGSKVVSCSKQCVLPLIMCRLSAGGSWPALLKCAKDFVQCAIGGCTKGVAYIEVPLDEDEDYSPYETAIAQYEENGGVLDQCKITHQDCLKAATSGSEKIRCFIQLGICLGTKVVGCSKQCILPLVMCRLTAGGSWPALLKCAKDFVTCAVGGCTKAVYIEGLMLPNKVSARDQCRVLFQDCAAAAGTSIIQKAQCLVRLKACLDNDIAPCAPDCTAPMLKCKAEAEGNWAKLLKCSTIYVKCVIGGCKKVDFSQH